VTMGQECLPYTDIHSVDELKTAADSVPVQFGPGHCRHG